MFLALIHVGGGSAVETAQPVDVIGPYATWQEAENAGKIVQAGVYDDEFLKAECFYSVVRMPESQRDPDAVIASLLAEHGDE